MELLRRMYGPILGVNETVALRVNLVDPTNNIMKFLASGLMINLALKLLKQTNLLGCA